MYTQSDLTWGGHASSGLDFLTKPLEGKLFFELRDRIMNVAPTAMGGLARSYRARVHGGVLDTVRARVCNAVCYLGYGMSPERGP